MDKYTQPVYEVRLKRVKGVVIRERPQIQTPHEISDIIFEMLKDCAQEQLVTVSLDNKNRIISITRVYSGSVSLIQCSVVEIIRPAIMCNASSFLIAHNHPGGDPNPSPEDTVLVERVFEASKLLNLDLLDSIITGFSDSGFKRFFSYKEHGLVFN